MPSDELLQVTALPGGVSNYVWKIVTPEGQWVLKQPLPKLATKVEWISDVRRIERERACMQFLATILPKGTVPKVVRFDANHHVCVMTCAPEEAKAWKERLMRGEFDLDVGYSAGLILRQIQEKSRNAEAEIRQAFEEVTNFDELRIDPFHRYLITQYPALQKPINGLVDELLSHRNCLVHGDYSPKNMLIGPRGAIVLIDFEVAHWGNPLYDASFCLGHLMLKGWVLRREAEALALIQEFLRGYGQSVKGLIPHLGLMLLARLDGKSPMPYVRGDALRARIRAVTMDWIQQPGREDPLESIKEVWQAK